MPYDAAGARRVETITQARREWKDAVSSGAQYRFCWSYSRIHAGQFVMVSSYA
jgi:hypothetical protein